MADVKMAGDTQNASAPNTVNPAARMSPGNAFRRALLTARKEGRCVAVPGAFNGLVGRIAAEKGFQAAYVSGAALTASAGVPDIGLLTLDHFTSRIREIQVASGLPLICDADTGFGEAEMVTRTVQEYAHAGAAALHIEDQVFPKRCGHLDGKTLVAADVMAEKVKRAADAARSLTHNAGFVICARTDAAGVPGHGMPDALARAKLFVESGADMIFPEGLHTREDFETFAKEMAQLKTVDGGEVLLLANMTEFGKTPYISVKDFGKMGYHCAIFPVTTLRCAAKAAADVLDHLADENNTAETVLDTMYSRKELYTTLGYTPGDEWSYPNATLKN